MKLTLLSLLIATLAASSAKAAPQAKGEHKNMKITPVLIVEEIEKSLPFWTERMGFEKTVEVPEGNRLGFVILVRGGTEVMLQSIESVKKDAPKFAPDKGASSGVTLFIEVDDFQDVFKRLEGYPIAIPQRDTFYGMREVGVFAPSGHAVVFACPVGSR